MNKHKEKSDRFLTDSKVVTVSSVFLGLGGRRAVKFSRMLKLV